MQIIKTVTIGMILAVIASIGIQQTAFATKELEGPFILRVTVKEVNEDTGKLDITVTTGDETTTKILDTEGETGTIVVDDFVLDGDKTQYNDPYRVCVTAIEHNNEYVCADSHRGDVKINRVFIDAPIVDGITYYDENSNVVEDDGEFVPSVYQGDDSTNTQTTKDQDSGVNVSFGDDSDNNEVNIDQRTTFADVIRDLVPIAKEGAHMAKDTAAQLLN